VSVRHTRSLASGSGWAKPRDDMTLPVTVEFIGGTQEADMAGPIDHEEVFARMALLLAAVVCLLVRGIGWAMDRSLRTIMPKSGDKGTPLVLLC
jgi:hypothetical protein